MKKFNRENLQKVRGILEELFEDFEEETGVKITIGNIRFSEKQFTTKLEAVIPSDEEEDLTTDEIKYKQALKDSHGIFRVDESNWMERRKNSNGKEFQLLGVKIRSKKYPIVARDIAGNKYKFTESGWKMMVKVD